MQYIETKDVMVVGGGPAGGAAAIAAARNGTKVLLIESTGLLGGMATSAMVPHFNGFGNGRGEIVIKELVPLVVDFRDGHFRDF